MSLITEWNKKCTCHSMTDKHLSDAQIQRMPVVPTCSYQRLWHDRLSLNRRVVNHSSTHIWRFGHGSLAQAFAQHEQCAKD